MAFFEELSQKLTQTGQEAMKKTKDMAEVVKLNGTINEKEKAENRLYCEIGKLYFEQCAQRDEPAFREQVVQLKTLRAELEELRDTVRRLKGTRACPACGKEQPYNSKFCNACGAELPPPPAPQPKQADGVICPNCGAEMSQQMTFCTNCGSRLKQSGDGEV